MLSSRWGANATRCQVKVKYAIKYVILYFEIKGQGYFNFLSNLLKKAYFLFFSFHFFFAFLFFLHCISFFKLIMLPSVHSKTNRTDSLNYAVRFYELTDCRIASLIIISQSHGEWAFKPFQLEIFIVVKRRQFARLLSVHSNYFMHRPSLIRRQRIHRWRHLRGVSERCRRRRQGTSKKPRQHRWETQIFFFASSIDLSPHNLCTLVVPCPEWNDDPLQNCTPAAIGSGVFRRWVWVSLLWYLLSIWISPSPTAI